MWFQQHSSGIHHGRGSEAKGIHFYQTIQFRQLQDDELMIPRNFVEKYWKEVSNPITLKFPNESACKMNWVQHGDDIWLQNWKRFARSLRCGDLLVFQYKGGSDFHVIILDDSELEIDYSSMTCNNGEDSNKHCKQEEKSDDCVEILNDITTTAATPQGTNIDKRKIDMNATQKKVSGTNKGGMTKKAKRCSITEAVNEKSNNEKNPSFEVKLTQTYAQGHLFSIPTKFSREYLNEFEGIAMIRVDEDRTWKVNVKFDYVKRHSIVTSGWKLFTKENNLQVGDMCKFEMTQSEPLSFNITISRAREEPSSNKLQGYKKGFVSDDLLGRTESRDL